MWLFFNSPAQKIQFNIHHNEFKMFTSDQRSYGDLYDVELKDKFMFGFFGPKNLYFNIYYAKFMDLKC